MVAEEILLSDYPRAQSLEEKQRLFDLARIDLEGGRSEATVKMASASGDEREAIELYLQKVETMESLCKAELAAARLTSVVPTAKKKRAAAAVAAANTLQASAITEVSENISRAVNGLQAIWSNPHHAWGIYTQSGSQVEEESGVVLLIDGIDQQPDLLTKYVWEVLIMA